MNAPDRRPDAVLRIQGTLPGLNDYIAAERTNRYKAAAMKRQCQQIVILCAKSQLRGFHPGRVYMHYLWVEKDRRRDKSNVCGYGRKIIEDGLIKAGVLKNDGWREIEGFGDDFTVDKLRPCVIVSFWTL